jgi:hypothetical protein
MTEAATISTPGSEAFVRARNAAAIASYKPVNVLIHDLPFELSEPSKKVFNELNAEHDAIQAIRDEVAADRAKLTGIPAEDLNEAHIKIAAKIRKADQAVDPREHALLKRYVEEWPVIWETETKSAIAAALAKADDARNKIVISLNALGFKNPIQQGELNLAVMTQQYHPEIRELYSKYQSLQTYGIRENRPDVPGVEIAIAKLEAKMRARVMKEAV